jgi:hypothetical protein
MPIIVSKVLARRGNIIITEASREKVEQSLKQFKKRIESVRQEEAPRYSFPSEKTRIRLLE